MTSKINPPIDGTPMSLDQFIVDTYFGIFNRLNEEGVIPSETPTIDVRTRVNQIHSRLYNSYLLREEAQELVEQDSIIDEAGGDKPQ